VLFASGPPPSKAAKNPYASDPLGKRPRAALCVLIVDDVADTRELYERYFRFRGVRVVTAADGVAAAHAAVLERPDIIVLDLAMPRMTGWEVIETLRRQTATKGIPIVVLSGQRAEDSAYEAGADSYVEKPCVPEDLLREVLRVLREPTKRKSN
jgi:two-component system cell cycle response regulator DivK